MLPESTLTDSPVTQEKPSNDTSATAADSGETKDEPKRSLRATLREHYRSKPDESSNGVAKAEGRQVEAERAPAAKAAEAAPLATPTAQPTALIAPPSDMKPEYRDGFSKLPPDQQAYVSQRIHEMRSEMGRITRENAERGKAWEAYQSAIPAEELRRLNLTGKDGPDIVRRALMWDREFDRTNPSRNLAAMEFLEMQGFDLDEIAALRQGGGQQQQQPNGQFLTREEAERLADERFEQRMSERDQRSYVDANLETVSKFFKDKPFLQDPGTAAQFEDSMVRAVQVIQAIDPSLSGDKLLERAYSDVMKHDPVFSGLNSRMTQAKDAVDQNAAAERALAASRSVSGGPGSGTPTRKFTNLRENLAYRYRQ